ncbi:enhanced entry protein LpnE [Microdochium nivale]|nr:enhanced entry protein LpnE [Microdochium nivale]
MADATGLQPLIYSSTAIREKTQACAQSFRKCLTSPQLSDGDEIWIEQKSSEFNWWSSGLNADKRGPGSLDSRLILRPDVRDVIVEVLEGLTEALQKHQALVLEAPVQEESIAPSIYDNEEDDPHDDDDDDEEDGDGDAKENLLNDNDEDEDGQDLGEKAEDSQRRDHDGKNADRASMPENTQRTPSPWSDMASSSSGSRRSDKFQAPSNDGQDPNENFHQKELREQKVYINTNLQVLIRIHTAIKRSGLKFRNKRADDELREKEEAYLHVRHHEGERVALSQPCGEHEVFRRYLTQLVLANGYTYNLLQRLGALKVEASLDNDVKNPYGVALVILGAYFRDPFRLTTVQRRLINANVVRRNRLIYGGNSSQQPMRPKPQAVEQLQQGAMPPINPTIQGSFVLDPVPTLVSPTSAQAVSYAVKPAINSLEHDEKKPISSYVAQPATELGSIFSITGALMPARTNRSAATKMSARVGHLDYPKCPAEHGHFPCPYCPNVLSDEYTRKDKWRAHVAQDLCAYVCVFENCESPEEMFSTTYEWMSHMARYHAAIEWLCPLCAKDGKHHDPAVYIYEHPEDLETHLTDFHDADGDDLDLLLESARQTIGIQQVACPLCRPGLVTHESTMYDDELVEEHGTGLIQLEEDEHIATHIHEFALQAFPHRGALSLTDSTSLNSQSSFESKDEITFQSFISPTSENQQASPYSWEEVHDMIAVVVEHLGEPEPLKTPEAALSLRRSLVQLLVGLLQTSELKCYEIHFDEEREEDNYDSTETVYLLTSAAEVIESAAFIAKRMDRFTAGHRPYNLVTELHNSIDALHTALEATQKVIERRPRHDYSEIGDILKSCHADLLTAELQLPKENSLEPRKAIQYMELRATGSELRELITRIESHIALLQLFLHNVAGSEVSLPQANSTKAELRRATTGYYEQLPKLNDFGYDLPIDYIASRVDSLRMISVDYQTAVGISGPEQEGAVNDIATDIAIYKKKNRSRFAVRYDDIVKKHAELSSKLEDEQEVPLNTDAGTSSKSAEARSSTLRESLFMVVPSTSSGLKDNVVPLGDVAKFKVLARVGAVYKSATTDGVPFEKQFEWAEIMLGHIQVLTEAPAPDVEARSMVQDAMLFSPESLHDLRVQAVKVVEALAKQGHPRAMYIQSKGLDFGWFGYDLDKAEAFARYQRVAEHNFARAYYRIGEQIMNAEPAGPLEHLDADNYFEMGRELGDAACSNRLGMMYLLGEHYRDQDIELGLALLKDAADGADEDVPEGAYTYGMLLLNELADITIQEPIYNQVLGPEREQARTYIEKAAHLGFSKAQLRLGEAYENGELGCDRDLARSIDYFRLAATRGNHKAADWLSHWYQLGGNGMTVKNKRLSFAYGLFAAEAGVANAQFRVGSFYEDGFGVNVDRQEADFWYRKAALGGHQRAIDKLESHPEVPSLKTQGDLPATHETNLNFSDRFREHFTGTNDDDDFYLSGGENVPEIDDNYLSLSARFSLEQNNRSSTDSQPRVQETLNLAITIERASKIPRRIYLGRQHPYCTINIGTETYQTETHRGGGRNPEWQETFNIILDHDTVMNHGTISITIRHDGQQDSIIASTSILIPYNSYGSRTESDAWIGLEYQGKPAGRILISTFCFWGPPPIETIPLGRRGWESTWSTSGAC